MLNVETLEEGDLVYAVADMYNDGGLPGVAEDALLVSAGTRGVIVRIGHLQGNESRSVFLVRFEEADKNLGEPIGCFAEELRTEE